MSSTSKTLELLYLFTPAQSEIGLSQLCRLAGWDKATTYRRVQSLVETGFIEQNTMTRRYRLGPALLQLAQTREATVPRKAGAQGPLHELADATGETTHASVLSGKTLYQLVAVESPRHSTRVIVDIQTFPLHATSSGLCALAFGPADLLSLAQANMTSYTPKTLSSAKALRTCIKTIQAAGFSRTDGSFESDVCSVAAPLFDQSGLFAGAVSVACVATRFTPQLQSTVQTHLINASRNITHNWGGSIPAHIEKAWADAQANSQELETAR